MKKMLDNMSATPYNRLIKRKELQTMTRDEMMTQVIRKYGFEHEETIRFAQAVMDHMDDPTLRAFFDEVMKNPIEHDDDEEWAWPWA